MATFNTVKKILQYVILVLCFSAIAWIWYFSNFGYDKKERQLFNNGYLVVEARLISNNKNSSHWDLIYPDGQKRNFATGGLDGSYISGEMFKAHVSVEDQSYVRILLDDPILRNFKYEETQSISVTRRNPFQSAHFTYGFRGKVYTRYFETKKDSLIDDSRYYLVKVNTKYPDIAYIYLDSTLSIN